MADNQWQVYPLDTTTGESSAEFALNFDENGQLISEPRQAITLQGANGAAANQNIILDFVGSSQTEHWRKSIR